MIGLIGGTGLGEALFGETHAEEHDIDTPFGKPSSKIHVVEWHGLKVALLARHGLRVLGYAFTENFRQRDTRRTLVSRIMYPLRRVTSALSPKLNSLLWGGNSLVVLAATEGQS